MADVVPASIPATPEAPVAVPTPLASALQDTTCAIKWIAEFGGQGINYWAELKQLYATGPAITRTLLDQAADALFEESSTPEAQASTAFETVLALKQWLADEDSEQDKTHPLPEGSTWQQRAVFSYPLIALAQAANYVTFLDAAGVGHDQMVKRASCAIGHSQGVVSAAIFAAASTTEEYTTLAVRFVRYMFWHGLRAQETFLEIAPAQDPSKLNGATPMLSVKGLPKQHVLKAIQVASSRTNTDNLHLSLVNGSDAFCITGLPSTLLLLKQALEAMLAPADANQTRVPHSDRKPVGSLAFVRLSCPFHSVLLQSAKDKIMADVKRINVELKGSSLLAPVYSTTSEAENLQTLGDSDIVSALVDMQLTQLADWTASWKKIASAHADATHILEFGPDFGAANMSSETAEAIGAEVVLATTKHQGLEASSIRSAPIVGRSQLINAPSTVRKSWSAEYAPRVCAQGKVVNKYTQLLKKQPVMVAGMTPTTSLEGIDLVAAIQNAGFHGELAAGGLSRPNIFEGAVNELVSKIKPGVGIAINMLYLNAKQWGFQFPMVLRMRKVGIPIECITIGAGIPTQDRAVEIISELQQAGINLICFKPGSVDGIYSVLDIASAAPTMNVMLQWTGGRAGGHHSFEDFHYPLVATYGAIRRVKNVLLVVGSGFGNWEDSHQYLTGEWSVARGGLAKMPADGILLGSRVMVAKEAATAQEVKQLLVDTPGITAELEWEQSYKGVAGGIVTVTSELGEPIHKVANRGSLLWKEFDEKYFSKPRDQIELAVRLDKDEIISRLNADFQKPYFGRKLTANNDDDNVADLEEMTYYEILSRMIELMYVNYKDRPQRWIHESFFTRVATFMKRSEQQFRRGNNGALFDQSQLRSNPVETLNTFAEKYSQSKTTLVSVVDADYFLDLCRTGGKPVNFVPVVDIELRTWFKKDSLWYSEDLDAVPERDAQRVCILQGPVAVRYSTVCNEPVGEIMGNIAKGFAQVVSENSAAMTESSFSSKLPTEIAGFSVEQSETDVKVVIPSDASSFPAIDSWIEELLPFVADKPWMTALLSSNYIVQEKKWVVNPIRALVKPQNNQTFIFGSDSLKIFDASLNLRGAVIEITKSNDSIVVVVNEVRPKITELKESVIALELKFSYHPELTLAIHEEGGLIDKVKDFYARFWVAKEGDEEESCKKACSESVRSTFKDEFVISEDDITKYKAALSLNASNVGVPVDFSTIVSWKPLIQSVFTAEVKGNLLNLVHLKHSYKLLTSAPANQVFQAGDEIVSTSSVSSLRIIDSGKVVSGVALISRKSVNDQMVEYLEPLVELKSEFLIRGKFDDFSTTFSVENTVEKITLSRAEDLQVLLSKSWFQLLPDVTPFQLGDNLEFQLTTKKEFATLTTLSSVDVTGSIYRVGSSSSVEIAKVNFQSTAANDSPVSVFLSQVQEKKSEGSDVANGGYNVLEKPLEIQVPENALAYAVASRDLNPIHRSRYAAILANLPNGNPIMHGLWSATKVRSLIVEQFGSSVDSNVVTYDVNFDGMVYPGDKLYVQARHTGLVSGKKIFAVEVVNAAGERVISARTQVKQSPMAFVFTGQGSAEVGMGMERYQESSVARDIWNRGDAHLRDTFGFSILEMVRKNPSSITIHFGGKKGRKIRENYMKLTCEDPETGKTAPLLPEINKRTQSFTFSAPEGLLFATQFSQPALVLLEKATFSEIEEAQLIPGDALFAGHSLGEYAGLSSFAGALAVEDVVEVVFLRGLIMQKAVKRDAAGRSDYGMVATNPTRVGPHFSEHMMYKIVDGISDASGKLLQVVNFNVQDFQYVVAGENVNLEALSLALIAFKSLKASADMNAVIADSLAQAQAKKDKADQAGRPFTLARGLATIPLVGIDVPFHSRELLGGVPSFRSLLRTKFDPEVLERQLPLLVNRYVPNLVATPFSLEKSYFEEVFAATQSPYLAEVLDPMQWQLTTKAQLAHLLVVELLAYQFASPVQWIKTQDLLFSQNGTGIGRFVEIGPAPTLTNMAQRTLKAGSFAPIQRDILWYQRDREIVHFELENVNSSASDYARSLIVEVPEPVEEVVAETEAAPAAVAPQAVAPPPVHIPIPAAPVLAPAADDAPVAALHVLRVLLAVRLNKELPEISAETDVKTLCAGKSAVQNEILGDLEKEFGGGVPDGAGEIPLKDLASKFASYNALGKVTTGLISKVVASKMPGGFTMSSVKEYLSATKGLGAGRMESVLAHSLLLAPQARLKSEAEARKWLDSSVDAYASFAGVSLARAAANVSASVGGMAFSAAPVSIPTVSDAPVDAKHGLLVLLAAKFGKQFSEISETSTIKELAAGKSAVQNEIVGDLEKEFGSGPDDAAEMKLAELASKFSGYASPGKVTSALIAKLLAGKMPGGFGHSAIKEHLSKERCLPAGRVESVLLHTLTSNPKQRLGDEASAKAWLDAVVDDYAKFAGIDIPYLSKLGGMQGGGGGPQFAMQQSSLPSDFEKRLKTMIADQVEALNNYLGTDGLDWHRRVETEVELREQMESSVSNWVSEHGEAYGAGISPVFDAQKERLYDSYWNWAMQDAYELYFRTALATSGTKFTHELPTTEGLEAHFNAMSRWINSQVDTLTHESSSPPLAWFKPYLCNRATPELLRCTKFFVQRAKAEGNLEISQAIQLLVEQVELWLQLNPVNMQIFEPMEPHLEILESGEMKYSEIPRTGVADSTDYVDEMARGLEYNSSDEVMLFATGGENANMPSAVGFESTINEDSEASSDEDSEQEDDVPTASTPAQLMESVPEPAKGQKLNALRESLRKRGKKLSPRGRGSSLIARSSSLRYGLNENLKQIVLPHVHIRKPSDVDPTIRLYDVEATCTLLSCMREMASTGISFCGKVALVTGCGRNSIGAEIVTSLLEGGATVFVTTSSFSSKTTAIFRSIYERHGSRGSRLIVLPFNQASKVDVEKIVAHIYNVHKLDLDFVIPFAALSEVGRTIADIDARSELAHRIMLTNTQRLLGEVVTAKKSRDITTRPALVLLPLSPNHGNFGGDGLYAESKLGVESLMNKWYSEGWEDQLSIVGAVIGWTRGTGLMSGNNVVAQGVEKLGIRTFSTTEMGFNLSALMHPNIVDKAAESPLWADLTGGMAQITDLKYQVDTIRAAIMKQSKVQSYINSALENEKKMLAITSSGSKKEVALSARANLSGYYCEGFPSLSNISKLAGKREQTLLRGMLDLRKVVVVAGFGEVGPWGNSRTRWEMESYGEFSIEGCIELAWLTGHIVYENGNWVDAKTKEAVADHEIKARYEEPIIQHSGIRIIEPDLFDGYDPKKKMILHQVAIDKKMAPIEVADREEAEQFRNELGKENVDVFQNVSGAWMIRLRKGSVLSIPRALSFDRFVAGQIPTGWSAERLGVPKDLAESVDPITLYVLVSTMEALVGAGVTDPYEFYQYVHVSEIGNTSGGGMGGMRAFKRIYQHRLQGKSAPSDTLQECFINTAPAWVNMLLLSSSGPIKTPVGACATAAESVDIGVDTIKSGKARVVVVGGYDDFGEEGSYEFAQMKATSDSNKEVAMGRDPKEMCRPCSTTRGGFMESQGAGMQLLMDAQLALDMGCPIYAIVALTSTATDKNGRSVPAPGQGILTTARESDVAATKGSSPLLDVEFRRRQFESEVAGIEQWYSREKEMLGADASETHVTFLDDMKKRKIQSAQAMWGDNFFQGRADIAPLRGALSVWNLTVDDIGAASFHGTGTKANDKNESEVTQKQLKHLGRSIGNPLPIIAQKNLTGHPKGAAAAWMMNGLIQVLNSGLIPGIRTLDNTCETLRKFDYLTYHNRSIQTDGIKAAMLKSFGFGQAGGEVLLVHPDYLLSTLAEGDFNSYTARREKRLTKMNTYQQNAVTGKHKLVQVKDSAPYTAADESQVYLDPTARAEYDPIAKTWKFGNPTSAAEASKRLRQSKRARKGRSQSALYSKKAEEETQQSTAESDTLESALNQTASDIGLAGKNIGVGVDVEPVATFENLGGREDFIRRNFTDQEMAYCYGAPHPASSFAGRWAAKEAVIKAISSASPNEPNVWKGAGAPLREIEIFMTASGAPSVLLSGYPLEVFKRIGLTSLSVSISHSGAYAVSQAIANFQA